MDPSVTEATLIGVPISVTDLRPGDQVGPEDVSLPVDFTILGVEIRPNFEARAGADMRVRALAADGSEVTQRLRANNNVFVRRYVTVVTVTRSGGAVDARKPRLLLRPLVGTSWTFVTDKAIRLRAGDTITLTAP